MTSEALQRQPIRSHRHQYQHYKSTNSSTRATSGASKTSLMELALANGQTLSLVGDTSTNNSKPNQLASKRKSFHSRNKQPTPVSDADRDLFQLPERQAEPLGAQPSETATVVANKENDRPNHNQAAQSSSSSPIDDDPNKQHHVGPVMGIFFKVWSLVKVTKVRHHQKMRRQNSDDATSGQFQYISGEQLTSGERRAALLQDGHFRRAGSQPAAGSSGQPAELLRTNRLQVGPASLSSVLAATGTNGTCSSSGVSSTASSTLASDAQAARTAAPGPGRAGLRVQAEPTSGADTSKSSSSPKSTHAKSWTSKIKRSATTVNQSDLSSYVSRYRFRRHEQPTPAPAAQACARQARAQSEANQADELQRRWMKAQLAAREAISDDDEQDSDMNDIYSTPNDSIQSVPSSGPIGAPGATMEPNSSCNDNKTNLNNCAQSYPMIKSFSTSNFSQLAKQQQASDANQFGTIDEHQEAGKRQFQLPEEQSSNEDKNNNSNRIPMASGAPTKRLSGSRFFISSSSSEDSNPPQTNGQSQQQSTCEQQKAQIPIQYGLHYHDPLLPSVLSQGPIVRPSSLLVGHADSALPPPGFIKLPGPLLTPTTMMAPAALAAISPATVLAPTIGHVGPPVAYRKSPSLFEISNRTNSTRFSSKFPHQKQYFQQQQPHLLSSFQPKHHQPVHLTHVEHVNQPSSATPFIRPIQQQQHDTQQINDDQSRLSHVPNSISLHDFKLSNNSLVQSPARGRRAFGIIAGKQQNNGTTVSRRNSSQSNMEHEVGNFNTSEYKLTQMLLELGSNPSAKDQSGCTALMHAVLSDNLPALKCLIEHGVDLNDTNNAGLSALDLVCSKAPTDVRMEMFKLLISSRADMDRSRESDGTRLLDRLIAEHQPDPNTDKLPFIDCLLHNGAKLGSSTWSAANGKHEIQLRLLRKLCQDGYFLYKKSSIEPAVYRFEYALKRIAELEQQLATGCCRSGADFDLDQTTFRATQQIKYQTYLGLSRCERKRKFFKRALEFAHMSILVDSTSYEGYYSKAHILKDLGEIDESLTAIDQTSRLVDKSIELIKGELSDLQHQEESTVFDGCFNMHDPGRSCWIEASRSELVNNLDYLEEAKKHISRLKGEIMENKRLPAGKDIDSLTAS